MRTYDVEAFGLDCLTFDDWRFLYMELPEYCGEMSNSSFSLFLGFKTRKEALRFCKVMEHFCCSVRCYSGITFRLF